MSDVAGLPGLPEGFRCYFNVATAELDDVSFLGEIERCLRNRPTLASHLGVEITETAAITNTQNSVYALDFFHRLGLRVSIDDFGTGYSSLSYLKRLPVDTIKIDRSFVTGLPADPKDVALSELLLQVSERFGFASLAEGIETEEQFAWLRDHGCRYGQGFLVSKALPYAEFADLIAQRRRLTIR